MAWVYVLLSERNGRFYIGSSGNPEARLDDHNQGRVKATRHLRPWTLVYREEFADAVSARRREYKLKSMKSHSYIQSLIDAQLA
jgi:putative endonuclease